ncbi:MAG: hypothetical protein FJW29_07085 [Acidobacteria bacterium]|nr:hypothetical protein [Acidobacteriota bacterium]
MTDTTHLQTEVIDELQRHGIAVGPDDTPSTLRVQLNDRYRIEIRALRDRCRAGEFGVRELPAHVVALRREYLLLSVPLDRWVRPA